MSLCLYVCVCVSVCVDLCVSVCLCVYVYIHGVHLCVCFSMFKDE